MRSIFRNRAGLLPAVMLSLLALGGVQRAADAAEKPNILFIFADDQCFETLGMLNRADIRTPNLDRLAKHGTIFSRAYNMGSYSGAVCIASRNMLNTGRFLWHSNRIHGQADEWRKQGKTWSELMKKAGYETYMTGKWHVRINAQKSFDHVTHVRPGMPNQVEAGYNRPKKGEPIQWKPWDKSHGGFWKGGKHWSEVLADDAEGFLSHAKGIDKPFFMYLAFNAPHDPRQSPKEFVEMYPTDEMRVPSNYMPKYPYRDAIGSPWSLRDERLAPMPRTEYAVKVNRREYYALITHMDRQVGRILDALEKTGKADNTWIFFTADHGLAVGHHGLMGKQNLFEHSMRVPFIVNGPGVEEGRRIRERIYVQDVMPTTLELAGVEKPGHVQFRSVLPVMRGERDRQYDAIYGGYKQANRCIIRGRYKLMLYPKVPKVLLFDLENDPQEMNNLADKPGYRSTVRKLFAELVELQKPTGDKLDLRETFPDL